MARKLKNLTTLSLAVLAVSAMVASSASADYSLTSTATNTDLTGEQIEGKHKFTVAGQSLECVHTTFTGTQTGNEASDLTITPTYANCSFGKIAHVTVNGCTYTFTGATQVSGHGLVHVICPTVGGIKQKIEVHITNFSGIETCTLTIAEQTPGQGYSAVNTGIDVQLTMTLSGIVVTTHGAALACKALAVSNATLTGKTTMRGYVHGSKHEAQDQVEISVD